MPRSSTTSSKGFTPVRLIGVTAAVGLHAAILAAIISVPPGKIEVELPETVEVRFVEISDEVQDAAPNDAPADDVTAVDPVEEPTSEPEPEPEPITEPEPEPQPEPVQEQIGRASCRERVWSAPVGRED